jgi:UDP-3-O-[3-hydroxymyristoyl] glucosamine N-acyltransferase
LSGVLLPHAVAVGELAATWGGTLDTGLEGRIVTRVVSPADASDASDLVVLTQARHVSDARRAAGILFTIEALARRVDSGRRWRHGHPMWVVARLLAPLAWAPPLDLPDRKAFVDPRADVAPDVCVGAGAVVHAGARIAAGCRIGENAVIYPGVELGERVVVGAGAVVGRPGFGWTHGPSGELERIPQLGGVVVEADVEIGALATVDAGTLGPSRLGRGVKLDAHVHVAHNVEIGPFTLVAAQSGFAGSARIGARVLVGGQVGVADHVRIGSGAKLAGKSGVIGDVPDGAVVAGFPAVPRIRWLRAMAALLGRVGQGR